jgi:hypothetical protein
MGGMTGGQCVPPLQTTIQRARLMAARTARVWRSVSCPLGRGRARHEMPDIRRKIPPSLTRAAVLGELGLWRPAEHTLNYLGSRSAQLAPILLLAHSRGSVNLWGLLHGRGAQALRASAPWEVRRYC